MKLSREFYTDFYGCTYSILHEGSGRSRLAVRVPQGDLIHARSYKTYRGAKIALGKYSDGTARLTGREEK